MRKTLLLLSSVLIILLSQTNLAAQIPIPQPVVPAKPTTYKKIFRRIDTVKNTDFSLKGQYEFMLSRSKSINGYKLINPARLGEVWKSLNDTLKKERVELKNARAQILQQTTSISGLKSAIDKKESDVRSTEQQTDQISFLGINFNKGTYNMVVWSIIIVLLLALFIVIARSAKSIIEAKHKTQLYEEISAEYQAHKVKANEQQRKLARELQDERNAIEEMRTRGK